MDERSFEERVEGAIAAFRGPDPAPPDDWIPPRWVSAIAFHVGQAAQFAGLSMADISRIERDHLLAEFEEHLVAIAAAAKEAQTATRAEREKVMRA